MPIKLISATCAVLFVTYAVYSNGLSGPFLLDDGSNLETLSSFGGVRDFNTFWLYLLSGISGPTGRPLSLLSFLIDAQSWPSDPYAFKHTNLILHLVNGALLYWLAFRLARASGREASASGWVALLVAGFWLLHPMNVSTVLYVVQRMTMLSALFTFAGLLAYVHGRETLETTPRKGYVWITAAIVIATPLAVFSKESGALLPLLALVLERTYLRRSLTSKPALAWEAALLWLPSLLIAGYLVYKVGPLNEVVMGRSFTPMQRLLTESIVLLDYFGHWWVPFIPSRGLFADDYPVSTGLLEPPGTALAMAGLAILLLIAWISRRKQVAITLAIGFFLAGHLLESSLLPLEIYFEHRNYLPTVLLFFPVAAWLVDQGQRISMVPALFGIVFLGLAVNTYRLASVWGDEVRLALALSQQSPNSIRAQSFAADVLIRQGAQERGVNLLRNAITRIPSSLYLNLIYLLYNCQLNGLTPTEVSSIPNQFRSLTYDFRAFSTLKEVVQNFPRPECKGVGFEELHSLLEAIQTTVNPNDRATLAGFHEMQAILYAREGRGAETRREFFAAQRIAPDIDAGLTLVGLLASNRLYADALAVLGEIDKLVGTKQAGSVSKGSLDYPEEILRLRKNLEDDLRQAGGMAVEPEPIQPKAP